MTESKDAYYFSHDANARNDSKMLRLRRMLGLEGYGIYFCLVEMLREQKGFCLDLDNLVDIAYSLHVDEAKVKSVVCDYDLFVIDEKTFYSQRLNESMETYKSLAEKRIEAGRKGGIASAKQRSSKKQAKVNGASSIKGKERKGKETKVNKEYTETSNEFRLSKLLLSLIIKRNTNHKLPNMQTWSDIINKMISIDNRNIESIEKVIRWCQSDSFWMNNILSTKKLREKFDQLTLIIKNNGHTASQQKTTQKKSKFDLSEKDYRKNTCGFTPIGDKNPDDI
jgi:hypothetical protein